VSYSASVWVSLSPKILAETAGARISVSVATIEFAKTGDGTALTWTEQGAYLDGFDGDQASALRREGTAELLDALAKHLAGQG
jgi:hypothetical protein